MKLSMFFVLLLMPFFSYGETFFKDQMRWKVEYIGTSTPEGVRNQVEMLLEGDTVVNDKNALKMYVQKNNDVKSKEFITCIRAEEEKVWFWHKETEKWYLMYDFSLQAGESVYVYSIILHHDGLEPARGYIRCVSTEADITGRGLSTMTFEEYESENCGPRLGTGKWIKGVGSTRGPLENFLLDLDGVGSILLEASIDNDIIYKVGQSGVCLNNLKPTDLKIHNNELIISDVQEGEKIAVYAIDGKIITDRRMSDKELKVTLPSKGTYIIIVGNACMKIFVS